MEENDIVAVSAWLVEQGLAGTSEPDLLHGFCLRCREPASICRGLSRSSTRCTRSGKGEPFIGVTTASPRHP